MNGWNKIKLGDVTSKIGSGATPRGGKDAYKSSGISLIRSMNVFDMKFEYKDLAYIDDSQAQKLRNVEVLKDDVLVNITGASVCRTTSVPDEVLPARVNQHVSIVRADKKNLHPYFLKYYLVHPEIKKGLYSLASTGATREALTKSDLGNFVISLPNYDYQKKLADIISVYDDLIENNRKRIKILEEMAQRLYTEWFVKFKFPGHEKVNMVDSGTEFGKIPEGWEIEKFRDLISYYIGGGWGKENIEEKYIESGHVIRGTDIPGTAVGDVASVPHRYHKPSNYKSRQLIEGDIVFEVSGGSRNQSIGRSLLVNSALLKKFKGRVICASFCKLIRPKENLHNYVYLSLLDMYSKKIMDLYQIKSTGISNFKFEEFLDHQIVLHPTDDVLVNFNTKIDVYYKEIQSLGSMNSSLSKTRDLLIENLITGKRLLNN